MKIFLLRATRITGYEILKGLTNDLADFVIKQINLDKFIHQKPVIAY